MKWLFGLLGKIPAIPGAIVTKLAIFGLVFVLGLSVGNHWATQRALKAELQASADRQRENHLALLKDRKDTEKKIRDAFDLERNAATAAYNLLADAKSTSDDAAERARASLRNALGANQNLKENVDALKNVNGMLAAEIKPADPGCSMPPGVRQAIDGYIASVNTAPYVGSAVSETTGLPLGPVAPDSLLTCRELAASVIDIIQHDAEQIGLNASWRVWAEEALR